MDTSPVSKEEIALSLQAFKNLNLETVSGSALVDELVKIAKIRSDRARFIIRAALDKGSFKTDKFFRLYLPQEQS